MSRYLSILKKGSPALREAIANGALDNVKLAAKIAQLPEEGQAEAVQRLQAGDAGALEEAIAGDQKPARRERQDRRGRKRRAVTTPRIEKPRVVQSLMQRLGLPEVEEDIDWDDVEQVHALWNRAFERLLKELEAAG